MSSRKKIRQAPGRLLRQKLIISVRCVARVETLPLKGPRLLIRHWILYTEKSHTQTYLLRLHGGVYTPPDTSRPCKTKYSSTSINKRDHHVLCGRRKSEGLRQCLTKVETGRCLWHKGHLNYRPASPVGSNNRGSQILTLDNRLYFIQ
jgi:hypothetical protein